MKKILYIVVFLTFALSIRAEIMLRSDGVGNGNLEIVKFEESPDYKNLYAISASGEKILIAKATKGVLVGYFLNCVSQFSKIGSWTDIKEIESMSQRFSRKRGLDYKIVYLPKMTELKPKDLGLDGDWEFIGFWFDYDRHKMQFYEKLWQFAVKNKKTGVTNTYNADDVEQLFRGK